MTDKKKTLAAKQLEERIGKELADQVIRYHDAGFNVLPITTEPGPNCKRPSCYSWKKWENERQTLQDVERMFKQSFCEPQHLGVGVIAGKGSGNLMILDFDVRDGYQNFIDRIESTDPDLYKVVKDCPVVTTMSGCEHLYYRTEYDTALDGNTVLAGIEGPDEKGRVKLQQIICETRGQGGYGVAPGSAGYEFIGGSLEGIPNLSSDQKAQLHSCARSFDQREPVKRYEAEKSVPASSSSAVRAGSPGSEYNERGEPVEALLERHGFSFGHQTQDGTQHWIHPHQEVEGKTGLTVGSPKTGGKVFVFSSSISELPNDRAYDKFQLYTHLDHGGDFKKAAKQLRREGFGKDSEDYIEYKNKKDPSQKFKRFMKMSELYTKADILNLKDRKLLSLKTLPGWDSYNGHDAPASGHGWGEHFHKQVGGVAPGTMVAIGASSAGAGKTYFVSQLTEGLAYRTAELIEKGNPESEPLTPVFFISEMSHEELIHRSAGRIIGVSGSDLRAGADAAAYHTEERFNAIYERFVEITEGDNIFAKGRNQFINMWIDQPDQPRGEKMINEIREWVSEEVEALEERHGFPVWPVVVIDSIQRFQDVEQGEVESLGHLSKQICGLIKDNGWIAFIPSDTNKAAAKGSDNTTAKAGIFRGSYELLHVVDVALYLSSDPDAEPLEHDGEKCGRKVTLKFAKNRWGSLAEVGFMWNTWNGRFTPDNIVSKKPPKPAKDTKKKKTPKTEKMDLKVK